MKTIKVVGSHVEWSEADVERMSSITSEDIAAAKATYKRLAPKRVRRLPNARVKLRG